MKEKRKRGVSVYGWLRWQWCCIIGLPIFCAPFRCRVGEAWDSFCDEMYELSTDGYKSSIVVWLFLVVGATMAWCLLGLLPMAVIVRLIIGPQPNAHISSGVELLIVFVIPLMTITLIQSYATYRGYLRTLTYQPEIEEEEESVP